MVGTNITLTEPDIENDECQMCSVRDDIENLLIDCVIANKIVFPINQINYMKCNEMVFCWAREKIRTIL